MAGNLGRIGGHLLKDNLLRNGNDLAFDTDLLYLKVSPVIEPFIEDGETGDPNYDSTLPASLLGTGIGINVDVPVFDLDVNNDILTVNIIVDNKATIDNIVIQNNSYFTTTVGPINLVPDQINPYIRHNRIITDDLEFNDNNISGISSEQSIELRPNANGTIELIANTNITGDLYVTGDINIAGNLTKQGNLILGDDVIDEEGDVKENDTVDFNVDFQQSFIPGLDNAFDLGRDKDDSSFGRWSQVYVPDWTNIANINPESVKVSDQIIINGVDNEIFALQSNDDVTILPYTGITIIEDLEFEENTMTNLLNTPLTFTGTDRGYYKFDGTNAFVLPAGNNSTRPSGPELGDTRWNTEEGYLECFDGNVYVIATGAGEEVTEEIQEDLANVYTLILG